jgi:hypothetical protein
MNAKYRKLFGLNTQDKPSDTTVFNTLKDGEDKGFHDALVSLVKRALIRKEIRNDAFRFGVVSFDGKYGKAKNGEAPKELFSERRNPHTKDKIHIPYFLRTHLTSSFSKPCIDQETIPKGMGESTIFPGLFNRVVDTFPKLFKLITGDSAFLSYDNCQLVTDRGKYYLFALKSVQKSRYKVAKQALKDQPIVASTYEKYQGERHLRELRFVSCSDDMILPGVTEIWSVTRTCFDKNEKFKWTEERFYVTSIPNSERLTKKERLQLVRLHWGIENNGNWTLDMIFEEDKRCICSKGNGPFVLAWLRLLAYNLVAIFRSRLPKEDRRPVEWVRIRKLIRQALVATEGVSFEKI